MNSATNRADILLVEDNATDAELTMLALNKSNLVHTLIWVKDGAEALDYIFASGAYSARKATDGPKVIFLDLRMPKLNGIEMLRRIKNDNRTRTIPVVVLTSSKEDLDIATSYYWGVNSYISKPVEFDAYVEKISQMGIYWLTINRPPPPIE